MPNHITTIINASQSVLNALLNDENEVDFNKMIPMPEGLHDISVDGSEHLVELLFGELSLEKRNNDILHTLTISNVLSTFNHGGLSQYNSSQFENFIKMLRLKKEFGYTSWYSWSCDNWGTKWNAYNSKVSEEQIKFDTAWSHPFPIIDKLSRMFPTETIKVKYADEDIGHNCGEYAILNGIVDEVVNEDPIYFSLMIKRGKIPDYYKRNPKTGKLEYILEDDQ